MASISTANNNLDGTGSLTTILQGTNNGNSITSIDIKAVESTSQGMVRLYFSDGVNTKLFWESSVPSITQDEVTPTYHSNLQFDFVLPTEYLIKASTQVGNVFQIITSSTSWKYESL